MQPLRSNPSARASLSRFHLETAAPIQLVDITDRVTELLAAAGLRDGLVSIFSRHTTMSVRVQENEPLLLEDLQAFLEKLAPATAPYRHNDFAVRTEHMHPNESPNGHAHCLNLLLGSSETVPVAGGELVLGAWQRLFAIELDGPRQRREILVQTIGDVSRSNLGEQVRAFESVRLAA